MSKFKGAFEELDQFFNSYDLAMFSQIKQQQIDSIIEDLFPYKLGTEQVIVITDYRKKKYTVSRYPITFEEADQVLERAKELIPPSKINSGIGMKKLSKTAYNKLVKAKILQTGLYNGRSVEEADIDDELYEHLVDIKSDYKKGVLTAFNADAEMAYNFLKYEDEYADDLDIDFGIDDLYGSYDDNMKAIKTHFGSY